MLTRARVLKGAFAVSSSGSDDPIAPCALPTARRVEKPIVDARLEAARILEAAHREAAELVSTARTNAQTIAQASAAEAREAEVARIAARFVALRVAEESAAERDLEKTVALAVALAERLLGASLELDPSRIALLAKQALAEARGARVIRIRANPLDAEALRTNLEALANVTPVTHATIVEADDSLARGSLIVDTNLGSLDAQLTPQLERLTAVLREHLAAR